MSATSHPRFIDRYARLPYQRNGSTKALAVSLPALSPFPASQASYERGEVERSLGLTCLLPSVRLLIRLGESESDDDVPLSKLRADKVVKSPAVKAEVKKEVKSEVKTEATATNGVGNSRKHKASDSDSDDDIPISGLARRKKMKVETAVPVRSSTPTRASPRSTPRKTKKRVIKIKIRQQECTEELYETLKGRLTQELLCRWWYAVQWPPVKQHTHGEDMGSILDTRSAVGKPSFLHFFAMSSEELQKLLLRAYDKQMEVLVEHEELQKARASAARISPEKADRGVRKVLKQFSELEREMKEVQALALKEENAATEEEDEEDEDTAGEDEGEGDTADDE
ncbi:hypothetical protein BBJ28_00013428 [Nothophytophthora sp. Chile5]|nr:hypothetical protein BBJ28_00013428 [Nothophytophthora sp. Chile5]